MFHQPINIMLPLDFKKMVCHFFMAIMVTVSSPLLASDINIEEDGIIEINGNNNEIENNGIINAGEGGIIDLNDSNVITIGDGNDFEGEILSPGSIMVTVSPPLLAGDINIEEDGIIEINSNNNEIENNGIINAGEGGIIDINDSNVITIGHGKDFEGEILSPGSIIVVSEPKEGSIEPETTVYSAAPLLPDFYDAFTSSEFHHQQHLINALSNRTRERLNSENNDMRLWVNGYLNNRDHDGERNHINYQHREKHIAVGVDWLLNDNIVIGTNLSAANTHVNVDSRGDGTIQTIDASIYGGININHLHIRGNITVGCSENDTERDIIIPNVTHAQADDTYSTNRIGASIALGYVFNANEWKIEPSIGIDYTYLKRDNIKENGADTLNLAVNDDQVDQLGASFTLNVQRPIKTAVGVLTPKLTASYRHVFTGDDRDYDAQFRHINEAIFTIDSQDDQYQATIGAGIGHEFTNGISLSVNYEKLMGENTDGDNINLLFGIIF